MTELGYRIFAAELREEFPRRAEAYPALYVGLSRNRSSSHDDAIERLARGKSQYSPLIVSARPDLVPSKVFRERQDGAELLAMLRRDLARQGFSVNPSRTSAYRLYVVDLDSDKLKKPGKHCVYVGMTSLSIQERLAQHASGVKAARVSRAFLELNTALTPHHTVFFSRWDANAEETELGKRLIREGYEVWGPQDLNE